MFDVDVHTLEVLIPSVVMVVAVTVAMVWAGFKMRKMMDQDGKN